MRAFDRWLYWQVYGRNALRHSRRRARRGPTRNWRYKVWVRSLPSCISGQFGCEAAHTGMRCAHDCSTCDDDLQGGYADSLDWHYAARTPETVGSTTK